MSYYANTGVIGALALLLTMSSGAEEVGERWGTEKCEREFEKRCSVWRISTSREVFTCVLGFLGPMP